MTKKELINAIIEKEYTEEELKRINGLYKSRYYSLAKYNKPFLQESVEYLKNI